MTRPTKTTKSPIATRRTDLTQPKKTNPKLNRYKMEEDARKTKEIFRLYRKGDFENFFLRMKNEAFSGNVEAQYNLGKLCFEEPTALTIDPELAVTLFRKAANNGHKKARCKLAEAYFLGSGVREDQTKAVNLLSYLEPIDPALAKKSLEEMQYQYGLMKMSENPQIGVEYLKLAALGGHSEAQFQLSQAYQEIPLDLTDEDSCELSEFWLQEAAKNGHPDAKEILKLYSSSEEEKEEEGDVLHTIDLGSGGEVNGQEAQTQEEVRAQEEPDTEETRSPSSRATTLKRSPTSAHSLYQLGGDGNTNAGRGL